MNKLIRIAACLTALCLIGATACAEMIFEGSVVCPEAVPVVSPFGAMVDSLSVSAGERIEKGAHVASMCWGFYALQSAPKSVITCCQSAP